MRSFYLVWRLELVMERGRARNEIRKRGKERWWVDEKAWVA